MLLGTVWCLIVLFLLRSLLVIPRKKIEYLVKVKKKKRGWKP